jgi:hypothetical protein
MIIEAASYPKWIYSATEKPFICKSEVEFEKLEGAWYDSPADIPEDKPVVEEVVKTSKKKA